MRDDRVPQRYAAVAATYSRGKSSPCAIGVCRAASSDSCALSRVPILLMVARNKCQFVDDAQPQQAQCRLSLTFFEALS